MIPESPHRIPSGGGNLSDKRWYAVCENEKLNQILIVPEEKTANIVLMDGRTLTTTKGFYVPAANNGKAKATLNIYGQTDDNGELKASAIEYVPAIGGNNKSGHGDINFYGGKIDATGGDYGAGIGTGDDGMRHVLYDVLPFEGDGVAVVLLVGCILVEGAPAADVAPDELGG